jgi:hypothetical protein
MGAPTPHAVTASSCALGLLSLLSGCAQTQLGAQYTDPQLPPQTLRGAAILVVCEATEPAIKLICESQISGQLTQLGARPLTRPRAARGAVPAGGTGCRRPRHIQHDAGAGLSASHPVVLVQHRHRWLGRIGRLLRRQRCRGGRGDDHARRRHAGLDRPGCHRLGHRCRQRPRDVERQGDCRAGCRCNQPDCRSGESTGRCAAPDRAVLESAGGARLRQ